MPASSEGDPGTFAALEGRPERKRGPPGVSRRRVWRVGIDPDQILAAAVSSRRDRISWDALILTAAAVAGCEEVLSEDLRHGQSFGRVRIVNPFRD